MVNPSSCRSFSIEKLRVHIIEIYEFESYVSHVAMQSISLCVLEHQYVRGSKRNRQQQQHDIVLILV